MTESPEPVVDFVATVYDVEKVYLRSIRAPVPGSKSAAEVARTRRNFLAATAISTVFTFCVFGVVVAGWAEPGRAWIVAAIVAPLISFASYSNADPRRTLLRARLQASQFARSNRARSMLGRHVIRIQQEGIRVATDSYEVLLRWPAVIRVSTDDEAIYVESVDHGGLRIPNRAFNEILTREMFVAEINRNIEQFGFEISSRILVYANVAKANCPACGYSLADLTTTQCPECGRVVTLEDFPSAAYANVVKGP